ncbi:bifunctional ornithine acetyltransferase/N-acetylglutamate synthase [Peribacillus alkalitolerans]|uniref:bifunctional ornithine acetyltransferase/N-acetylglutamate synthase n=1 Tax=Peribacillus alkalitolerans TaxID=1550385 RepID=UPI0013D5E8ED|nr:bifunctional ornithine acetyltransferase/N-acetylglutamate synthase [Peribacillus alkalitolerans]
METVKQRIQEFENGTILSVPGFKAAGVHAGLRYAKKDVGVILSEKPAASAAVFTTNVFQAAPLSVTKDSLSHGRTIQAIIVNSACANACTGEQGMADAYEMRKMAASHLQVKEHHVAVASTGVIGEYMKMDKIQYGINLLNPSGDSESAKAFQTAILTTDTVIKGCAYQAEIGGKLVTMGGAAKGSGMIHPNMATMLGFITTDAAIDSISLQHALSKVTNETFNQITVDGDTSTNDMVMVLANGYAGHDMLTPEHKDWDCFVELLKAVSEDLAKKIAKDGEGATKLIEVQVTGAKGKMDAQKIAKTIVGSNLVKSAMYGADANWGRIIGAMGRSGVLFDPDQVDISFGNIVVLNSGQPVAFSEQEAQQYLQNNAITIHVKMNEGKESGIAWGCDLTYDYVKINASYRS